MAYENPFANKSGSTSQNDNNMDEDEDDDLKQPSEPLTARQRKFQRFKELQANPELQKKIQEQKAARNQAAKRRKKLNKQRRRRANSLPRSADTNTNNKSRSKSKSKNKTKSDKAEDYIWYHEPTQTETSKSLKTATNKLDGLNLETSTLANGKTKFDALAKKQTQMGSVQIHNACYRSIRVPGHRMIHVRRMWKSMCQPIVKQLKLQIRMNSRKNLIELRMSNVTEEELGMKGKNVIQKGSDFVRAIVLGFEIRDSLALIRMDDVFLESFDIRDVKFFNKKSDHWMRAIGRIAGQYGKIKYSIENSTNTRIVIFGFKVHILGSFSSIRLARNSISRLVIGSAPGNVYAKLRVVSNRLKHKF